MRHSIHFLRWAAISVSCTLTVSLVSAQTKETVHERTVLTDARTRLNQYVNLNPDCSVAGKVTVRVTESPAHGTLEIDTGPGFSTYKKDNVRAKCNAQEVEHTRVWYKANPEFKGRDRAQVEAFSSRGTSRKATFQITVK
jgi:hypothetical protein